MIYRINNQLIDLQPPVQQRIDPVAATRQAQVLEVFAEAQHCGTNHQIWGHGRRRTPPKPTT